MSVVVWLVALPGTSAHDDFDEPHEENEDSAEPTILVQPGTVSVKIEQYTSGSGPIKSESSTSIQTDSDQTTVDMTVNNNGTVTEVTQMNDSNATVTTYPASPVPIATPLASPAITVTTSDGHTIITIEHTSIRSELPVTVIENSLTVTTSGKTLTIVSPVAVIDTLTERGLISQLDGEPEETVTLTQADGQPVYRVRGRRHRKVFGIFPIQTALSVTVSATNQNFIAKHQSWRDRLLEIFSAD